MEQQEPVQQQLERGQWQRVGSLWPFSLVGGDRAAREPRFAALAVCAEAAAPWPANDGFRESERAFLRQALASTSLAQPGTALEIELRGKRLAATVVPLPFVPHRYHRQSQNGAKP